MSSSKQRREEIAQLFSDYTAPTAGILGSAGGLGLGVQQLRKGNVRTGLALGGLGAAIGALTSAKYSPKSTEPDPSAITAPIVGPPSAAAALLAPGGAIEEESKAEDTPLDKLDSGLDFLYDNAGTALALGALGAGGYGTYKGIQYLKDRKEKTAGDDGPTNFADYIKENPIKSTAMAGLGSTLLYNALGGREGIQSKLQAMADDPLATTAGLGSLGVLSGITYEALKKQSAHGKGHESKYTAEYNHHSVLDGKQKTELPDFLQKEIIESKTASTHETKYTKEYDNHPALRGKQKTDLPDFMQRRIVNSNKKTANFGEDVAQAVAASPDQSYLKNMGAGAALGTGVAGTLGLAGAGITGLGTYLLTKNRAASMAAAKEFAKGGLGGGLIAGTAIGGLRTMLTNKARDLARNNPADFAKKVQEDYEKADADRKKKLEEALTMLRSKTANQQLKDPSKGPMAMGGQGFTPMVDAGFGAAMGGALTGVAGARAGRMFSGKAALLGMGLGGLIGYGRNLSRQRAAALSRSN
jgi:hypothetical protein